MSRVERPTTAYAAIIPDLGDPDAVAAVKGVLDQIVNPSRTNEKLDPKQAELACFFGLAVQNDIGGIVFFRPGRQFRSRTEGCAVTNNGKPPRTWVQATKLGKGHQAEDDEAARKKELAGILTKQVYFYEEVSKYTSTSDAKILRRIVVKKSDYAPWLDVDQVQYRINWRERLK